MKIEEIKKEEKTGCYSTVGFLVDVLEDNGFGICSLKPHKKYNRKFRIDVEILLDDETMLKLMQKRCANYQVNLIQGE